MKRGVVAFVGPRLRLARELRSIGTAAALADMLNVSRQAVSQYENGQAKPTPDQLELMAQKLNVPIHFFLLPMPHGELQQPFFRSMAADVAVERRRARALLTIMADLTTYLLKSVELPEPNIPKTFLSGNFREWSNDQIEAAAAHVRRAMNVATGPMPNLTIRLEHLGIVVSRDFLADRELDGLSKWIDQRPFVLLNNTKSAARSRLDLAHELGHVVMHGNVDPSVLEDKRAFPLLEQQAFRFAGALLLPREDFPYEIVSGSLEELLSLKARWQVSIAALIYRIEQLALLPKATTTALWRKRSRNGWHVREPLEDAVRPEAPSVLRSSNEMLRDQGGLSGDDIVDRSGLPRIDYLRLSGLEADFVEASLPDNVIRLHGRPRNQA